MNPAIGQEDKHLYEFGAFRLDPAERVLARNGERISLAPKAFDTLLLLVRQSGHVLSKDELIKTLWPDSFVEENNLTQQISQLRRALTDGADGQSYIETVPKLGYRFIPEVREIGGGGASAERWKGDGEVIVTKRTRTHIVLREEEEEVSDEPVLTAVEVSRQRNGTEAQAKWRARTVVAAVALTSLLLVSAWAAIYRYWNPAKPPVASAGTRTLAVLPLRNLKPDAETDFLSLALTDAIINRLGYANELTVEPLSSVAKYRGTDVDARQIARELNVQNVLAGSYIKDGEDLRITTEFISADKNVSPRRENVEVKYDKLFRVQDWVAVSVIHSMGLALQPQEAERFNQGVPTNPVAYEYYLRGINQGFKSDWASAGRLLEKSVALEPGNAMAWNELGTVYVAYGENQGGDSSYVDKGWQAFQRAIALDPQSRFIVDTMAFQLLEHNRAEEAIGLLQESLQRNPTDSFAHWYLSEAYRYGGALEQSVAEGELALKLNPNVAENLTFNTYLYVGQYQKFLDSLPRDENNARAIFYRGLARYYLNDARAAEEDFDHAFALNPALLHARIGDALACGLRGRNQQGLELMGNIERAGGDDGEMSYKIAQAYSQLGDAQSSIRLLRRSIELNFYPYTYFVRDPLLDPIRSASDYSLVMELAHQRQEAFLKRLH
jgi:DNA-binding winged helix-turn-helix (wHTH) protein/TolB-like protein/tetratricopeptide (TPR) repeat protein